MAIAFQRQDCSSNAAPSLGQVYMHLMNLQNAIEGGHNQGSSVISSGGLCRFWHHRCT